MKKLVLAAALLAIAGMAMAETFSATLNGVNATSFSLTQTSGNDYATVASAATLNGQQSGGSVNYFAVNNWVWNGSTLSFDVQIADDYELTSMSILGGFRAAGTSAPANLQWSVGSVNGQTWTLPGTGAVNNVAVNETISGLSLTGNVTISLAAVGVATLNNADRSSAASWYSGGTVNVYNTTFTGTVQERSTPSDVPEPATLGLLGLGALAVVLRRKFRK
mgnify:CR=1 FL=1